MSQNAIFARMKNARFSSFETTLSFALCVLWLFPQHVQSQHPLTNKHLCSKASHAGYTLSNENAQIKRDYHVHYVILDLEADLADSTLSGITTIAFTASNTLSQIELDAGENLRISAVFGQNQTPLPFTQNEGLLQIELNNELQANESDTVIIEHSARADADMFAPLSLGAHETGEVMWTLSQPFGAREWWPCNQDLTDKIDSIEMRITTADTLTGVSNGVLTQDEISGGQRSSVWKHNHPIPAYLVCLAVSNYALTEQKLVLRDEVLTIKNYLFPQSAEGFRRDIQNGAETFFWFDSLLIPYPYIDEKYGHAQMLRWGGMEHTTLSFMNNFNIELYTHELAHQWFGDLITCGSWSDIWLNEGFATFFQGLVFESFVTGEDLPDYWQIWKTLKKERILEYPDGSVYVEDTTNVNRIFDGRLSYDKGGFVLLMLREKLGHDVFFKAINNYLENSEFVNGYATTPDVIREFERACNCELNDFFDRWIYGEGYPIFETVYESTGGEIILEVEQKTSHASVPFFPDSFELAVWQNGKAERFKTALSTNRETLRFPFNGKIDSITHDPRSVFLAAWRAVKKSALKSIKVYPNPASHQITVEPADFRQNITEIRMYDARGRVVRRFSIKEPPPITLETTDFTRGIYTLQVDTETSSFTQKIILH